MGINAASVVPLVLAVLIGVAGNPASAAAQVAIGHVSGGPGLVHGIGHRWLAWDIGGGGELLLGDRGQAAVGGEFALVYFPESHTTFDGGRGSSTMPAVSAAALNVAGTYYFGEGAPHRRIQPFMNGGLTFLFSPEAPPSFTVGGGVDVWTTRRVGLRVEARAMLAGWVAFRCGVVFR